MDENKIKGTGNGSALNHSFIHKIVRFPFKIIEKISENSSEAISSAFQNSFIIKAMFSFLNSALSLNTRFYAVILLLAAIFRCIAAFSVSTMIPNI